MISKAIQTFEHAIQDALDLLQHFDNLNTNPPPPEIEVLKRASLVMAMAALETYFEDRLVEASVTICSKRGNDNFLAAFLKESLDNDLKYFHTPSTDRVRAIYKKYLGVDVTEGWSWNNVQPAEAKIELNHLARKRGDVAHRSWRPINGQPQPQRHIVTREDLRKHINFVRQLARATDAHLAEKL